MYKMIRLGKACHHEEIEKEVQDCYTKEMGNRTTTTTSFKRKINEI
jgi:hypothetical protein